MLGVGMNHSLRPEVRFTGYDPDVKCYVFEDLCCSKHYKTLNVAEWGHSREDGIGEILWDAVYEAFNDSRKEHVEAMGREGE